jgi:hypothetical protein
MGNNGMVVDYEGFMTKRFGKAYSGRVRFRVYRYASMD